MSSSQKPRTRQRTSDNDDSDSDRDDVSSNASTSSHSGSSDEEESSLHPKLPTLPDLRFEQSYLATIRGFLHEDEPEHQQNGEHSSEDEKGNPDPDHPDHHHKVSVTKSKARDSHELWLGNLRVEWYPILYVTVRDQLVSPLVQGAVWGFAGILLTQFRQFIAARSSSSSGKRTPVRSFRRR